MTKTILLLLIIGLSKMLYAQDDAIDISSGVVFSKFVSQHPSYEMGSTWRRSAWLSVDHRKALFKYFQIETSLTYQERTPLELLPFSMSSGPGDFSATILYPWPTNPQNELFDQVDYARRFPNFRYAHLELVPGFRIDRKLSGSIGIGFFAGILLNKNQTLITKDDFDPRFHSLLTTQGVIDTISYTRFDIGFLPKFSIGFRINRKLSAGIKTKYYYSLYRLNDTLVRRDSFQLDNMRWRAILSGLYLSYDL